MGGASAIVFRAPLRRASHFQRVSCISAVCGGKRQCAFHHPLCHLLCGHSRLFGAVGPRLVRLSGTYERRCHRQYRRLFPHPPRPRRVGRVSGAHARHPGRRA